MKERFPLANLVALGSAFLRGAQFKNERLDKARQAKPGHRTVLGRYIKNLKLWPCLAAQPIVRVSVERTETTPSKNPPTESEFARR
jgi:hypothetical protein